MPAAGQGVSGTRPTIAILANRGFAVSNSRMPLIVRMRDAGWRVLLITADDGAARQVESLGVTLETVAFHRGGLSPLRDLRALVRLIRLFGRYRPELVHFFHSKPILLGTIAIAAIPGWRPRVVSTITGLGYAYLAGGPDWWFAAAGYRLLVKRSHAVIFQNRDDRRIFVARKWVDQAKAALIGGSGVDTRRFRPAAGRSAQATVLMLSRLIRQKGVQDYLDAAKILGPRFGDVSFLLAGELESGHADRISADELARATRESGVTYLGFVRNVEELLAAARVLVFPSYYREGLPRVVIEAAACAVPAIGADVPGTRDAIEDGTTGFLVPPQDPRALAGKIGLLLGDEELRARMGSAARRKALAEFDIDLITEQQIGVYKSVLPPAGCGIAGP